jgi:tetratricopeptide (TPR) repeat protein
VCATLGEAAVPVSASLAARRGFVNFGIGDIPAAIGDFDRMLDAARHLGGRSLEGTALGFKGLLQIFNNDWGPSEVTLRAAQAIAEEGFDEVRPVANIGLAFLMFSANRMPEAETHLLTADEIAALPDPFLEGQWNMILGFMQHWWGRSREAVGTFRRMSESAGRIVANRLWQGWAHSLAVATLGDYEEALRMLTTLQATCERVGDVLILPRVFNTFGWIYGELQDHQRAMEWNQACVDFVEGIPGFPNPDVKPHALINLGDNLIALGRPDEADAPFEGAEAVYRSPRPADRWMAWRYGQHLFHSYGELWLARGDLERAQAYADECLEVALFNSSAKNVVKGRRLRGQILLAQDRFKEAEDEVAAALATAHEVGNPPQLWNTHAAMGALRWAQGRPEEARRAYTEALSVIEGVAASLTNAHMRDTFLHSDHVETMRRDSAAQHV